ncbi:MAG: YggS family pyridoxal phosphate-dependent enzyme [Oceanococcus sp.]
MTSTTLSANERSGNQILQRLENLQSRIQSACRQAGRSSNEITLLPVSKTQNAATLKSAWWLGLRCFGENYLQEAENKIAALPDDIEWHFIGPLQSNKTRQVAQLFDWVHSVDRLKVAQRLSQQRPIERGPLNICIQVNINNEASKSGVSANELPALVEALLPLENLRIQGLMCLPLASTVLTQQRASFRAMRELRDNVLPDAPVLSMGMSSDLEAAIAEGSTLIRIGTALFGPRSSTKP